MRRRLTAKARLAVFAAHGGICSLCAGKIHPGEAWDIEHTIPLAMGGADDETNWTVVHAKCHRAKTADDVGAIAKAKRREARHFGAKAPSRNPIPGGRQSPWKRKMNGEVVPR